MSLKCEPASEHRGAECGDAVAEYDQGRLPESQGHNLALTVLYVTYSLDSGVPLKLGLRLQRWVGISGCDFTEVGPNS